MGIGNGKREAELADAWAIQCSLAVPAASRLHITCPDSLVSLAPMQSRCAASPTAPRETTSCSSSAPA